MESGADQVARRMREQVPRRASPAPTEQERETFFSLLGYHYGRGAFDDEEFSRRLEEVHFAATLAELYEATADLPFPPPLADLDAGSHPVRRRRWRRH